MIRRAKVHLSDWEKRWGIASLAITAILLVVKIIESGHP